MSLTTRKRYANTAARSKLNSGIGAVSQIPYRPPITIASQTLGNPTVVELDQVVSLAGIPPWPSDSGNLPISATLTAPMEVTLDYPVGDSPSSFTVPFQSLGIRNGGGGFVLPGTFS